MEVILSVDPGWKLGWAVLDVDTYHLLEYGVMNFQRELGEEKRYKALWSHLWGLKHRHNFGIMLIEPPFGRFRSTRNGEICGIIKMSAYESNIPVKEMNVLSVRAKLKVKGKEEALVYARQWTGNEHLSTHEADAICQGLVYLKGKKMSCEEYGKEPLVKDCCKCGKKLSEPLRTIFDTFYLCDDCSDKLMPEEKEND